MGSHTMASESRPSVPDLLARETRRRPSVQLGRRLAYGELDGPWDEPGSGAFEELSSIPTPRHRDRGTSSPFSFACAGEPQHVTHDPLLSTPADGLRPASPARDASSARGQATTGLRRSNSGNRLADVIGDGAPPAPVTWAAPRASPRAAASHRGPNSTAFGRDRTFAAPLVSESGRRLAYREDDF